jgi:hypothetical protein
MIITDQITRYVVTLGIGATSTTFPFDYLDISSIYVYYDGVLKTLNVDYTINNKTVTFTPALTATTKISIILTVAYGKDIDFIEPEEWNADTVNTIFAKLALQIMELRDKAILVTDSSSIVTVQELIQNVNTAAESASASALKASQWADSPTDVEPNRPSAKTWALSASLLTIPDNSITDTKMVKSPFAFSVGDNNNCYPCCWFAN